MKLSVIVPVYNTGAYLRQCLESLCAQVGPELEIICVDDGSTDGSPAILREFAGRDARIRVVRQENRGLSGARNSGLRIATGDYVCFVDSDDALLPGACERMLMEAVGKDADLVVFGADTMDPGEMARNPWLRRTLSPPDWICRDGSLYRILSQPGAWPYVWRNCVRRSLLTEQGLWFDETLRYGEDTVFQMELLPACRRVAFISDRLYRYRTGRSDSLTAALEQGDRAALHVPMVERVAQAWQQKGWMERHGDVFLAWSAEFAALDVRQAGEERRAYARRLLRIWRENGLTDQPCTKWCRMDVRMIEHIDGAAGLPYYRMKVKRAAMVAVYRTLRRGR